MVRLLAYDSIAYVRFDGLQYNSIVYDMILLPTKWFDGLQHDSIACGIIRFLTKGFDCLQYDSIDDDIFRFAYELI